MWDLIFLFVIICFILICCSTLNFQPKSSLLFGFPLYILPIDRGVASIFKRGVGYVGGGGKEVPNHQKLFSK